MKNHLLKKILSLLKSTHIQARREVSRQWDRVLPTGEYISDRWEKAAYLGFGKGSSIHDSSHVFGDVKVGENTWVGPFTILDGSGKLEIGSNCSISAGVQIYSHDSVEWATSGGKATYDYAPVSIGDRCYLGPNVIVTKGVTIGDGCVIGANTVVMKNLPAGSKLVGSTPHVVEN